LATTASATEESSDRGLYVANEGIPKEGSLSDPSDLFVPKRILRSRSFTDREGEGNSIKNDPKDDNSVGGTSPEKEHDTDLGILEDFHRDLQDACEDDEDFVRSSNPGLGRPCSWVTEIVSGNPNRKSRCNLKEPGGKFVRDFCPKTCNVVCINGTPDLADDGIVDCQELCGTDRPVIGTDQSFRQSVNFKLFPGYAGYTEGSVVYPGDIECWDTSQVTDMSYAFLPPIRRDTKYDDDIFNPYRPYKSVFNEPLRCWDTSSVTSMNSMFRNNNKFNSALRFNTSAVTNMERMFFFAQRFNQPVFFDTSSVTTMSGMFEEAEAFDQPLDFDGSSLTNVDNMFSGAYKFNQSVDFLGTSKLTSLRAVFAGARKFDQSVNFDTSSVTSMSRLFSEAWRFNQPVNFNTSKVTRMDFMFHSAKEFNQPVNFDTSSVIDTDRMFKGSGCPNQEDPDPSLTDKPWCQLAEDALTPAPTPVPTPPPCKDSAYKAIVNGKGRTCRWIARNGLCESRKYAFHCRSSCGKCATCRDSLARFIMPGDMFKNGKARKIRCSTLRKDPRKEQRCKNLSNAYTCPGTCRKYANRNPCGSNFENPE